MALVGLMGFTAIACKSSRSTGPSSVDPCTNSGAAAIVTVTGISPFASATITVGQSVCWQNKGTLVHTVTDNATSGRRFDGNLPAGQAFQYTFSFGGSFVYHCSNHSNMTGTVVVNCKPGDLTC